MKCIESYEAHSDRVFVLFPRPCFSLSLLIINRSFGNKYESVIGNTKNYNEQIDTTNWVPDN